MSATIPEPFYRGKVRDLYSVDEGSMIIVASDRVSAFDVVFSEPVPGKGMVLNTISQHWFMELRRSGLMEKLKFKDHVITADVTKFPTPFTSHEPFRGRSMHVRRTKRVDFECVVRGYLAGSGWKDYKKTGKVCGHDLPTGLELAAKLPQPIFTPATKAPDGEHDENVTVDVMRKAVGEDLTRRLEEISIAIYNHAAAKMEEAGILLCDTKFEFGLDDDDIVLIDEVLTPDSSRYWEKSSWKIGQSPSGFDKQYIRDFVETCDWDKRPPAPALPADVISHTMELYRSIEKRILTVTG